MDSMASWLCWNASPLSSERQNSTCHRSLSATATMPNAKCCAFVVLYFCTISSPQVNRESQIIRFQLSCTFSHSIWIVHFRPNTELSASFSIHNHLSSSMCAGVPRTARLQQHASVRKALHRHHGSQSRRCREGEKMAKRLNEMKRIARMLRSNRFSDFTRAFHPVCSPFCGRDVAQQSRQRGTRRQRQMEWKETESSV